jgi:hypothetical protein
MASTSGAGAPLRAPAAAQPAPPPRSPRAARPWCWQRRIDFFTHCSFLAVAPFWSAQHGRLWAVALLAATLLGLYTTIVVAAAADDADGGGAAAAALPAHFYRRRNLATLVSRVCLAAMPHGLPARLDGARPGVAVGAARQVLRAALATGALRVGIASVFFPLPLVYHLPLAAAHIASAARRARRAAVCAAPLARGRGAAAAVGALHDFMLQFAAPWTLLLPSGAPGTAGTWDARCQAAALFLVAATAAAATAALVAIAPPTLAHPGGPRAVRAEVALRRGVVALLCGGKGASWAVAGAGWWLVLGWLWTLCVAVS